VHLRHQEIAEAIGKLRAIHLAIIRIPMEAERVNQLASSLTDLEKRSAELRRYL